MGWINSGLSPQVNFVSFENDTAYDQEFYLDGVNGLDTNDGTSSTTARKTYAGIVRAMPHTISGEAKVLLHVAGTGGFGASATSPLSYAEPSFVLGGPGSMSRNGFCVRGADFCAFVPTTGPATAALDVVPCVEIDQANVAAPGSGFRTRFDFTTAAPGWTANNFRNSTAFLRVTRAGVLVIPETPITENTADTLTIDIVCTATVLATDTVEIVRPSVKFTGTAGDSLEFLVTGRGTPSAADTFGSGTGNGNTLERIEFVGWVNFRNFTGGLDTCATSGSIVHFWDSTATLMQCKFQTACSLYTSTINHFQGHPRFTSGVNPILQTSAARTTLCAIGTMVIGDTFGGPAWMGVHDTFSHYGGSSLSVKSASLLSALGSNSANILGSGSSGAGLWARYGGKIIVNTGTRTQKTGTGGALRVGAAAVYVAYGTGVGAFEEVAGYAGNLYKMDGSVAATPTGDTSQIAVVGVI